MLVSLSFRTRLEVGWRSSRSLSPPGKSRAQCSASYRSSGSSTVCQRGCEGWRRDESRKGGRRVVDDCSQTWGNRWRSRPLSLYEPRPCSAQLWSVTRGGNPALGRFGSSGCRRLHVARGRLDGVRSAGWDGGRRGRHNGFLGGHFINRPPVTIVALARFEGDESGSVK